MLATTAGNRAVQRLLRTPVGGSATPALLSVADVERARAFTDKRFDHRSVRIVQMICGTTSDGSFGPVTAQAVAQFQDDQGLHADGMVGPDTLERQIQVDADRNNNRSNAIHLVTDFFNLNTATDTLSVHFDATVTSATATRFEAGGLRVIRLGESAFSSVSSLHDSIIARVTEPRPMSTDPGPRPSLLSGKQVKVAVAYNEARLSDWRAARAVQGTVGSEPDGRFGPDSVQRIAHFQDVNGLEPDGKVGKKTVEAVYEKLRDAGDHDATIRLLVDYFDLDTTGLMDIHFVENLKTRSAGAGGFAVDTRSRVTRVLIGPGCAGGSSMTSCALTLAHELEHVRLNLAGVESTAVHEFQAHTLELLAIGLPEMPWIQFVNKAKSILTREWPDLSDAEKAAAWKRFQQVRAKVRERLAVPPPDAEPQQVELAQEILAAYDDEVPPTPPA